MLDPFVLSFKLLIIKHVWFDKSIWDLAIVKLEEKKTSLKERKNNTHQKASGLVVTVAWFMVLLRERLQEHFAEDSTKARCLLSYSHLIK